MFATELHEEIIRAWEVDQNFPNRSRAQKPLPDIRDVRAVVETAFWASLKREEDHPITFALVLMPRNAPAEQGHPFPNQILTFNKSLPLSVESVTKLAPAFNPDATALAVASVDDQRSEYEIWGAVLYAPTSNLFTEAPVCTIQGLTNLWRPDAFMVTAISAGSLLISRGDTQIGRLIPGEFTKAIPTPFNSYAMGEYIAAVINEDEGYKGDGFYLNRYYRTLEYLLARASARGHGGTIIILPGKRVSDHQAHFAVNYSFEGDLQLEYLLNEIVKSEREHNGLAPTYKNVCREKLDVLAQLSRIDGALILSSCLDVITFGATLKAPKWEGHVLVGSDGFGGGGQPFDASKLGTRHNSAINFIGACPGAIGFVLSQDGPIRGLSKRDIETVLCWPDCLVSMFI